VTIPATVPQRSDIPEGLRNYPVYLVKTYQEDAIINLVAKYVLLHWIVNFVVQYD
jgi:hypothetical protein